MLNSPKFSNAVKVVLFALSFVVFLPDFTDSNRHHDDLFINLDPSCRLSLDYFANNDFTFGKDIVYTYGPLSVLSYKCNVFTDNIYLILFGLFQLSLIVGFLVLLFKNFKPDVFNIVAFIAAILLLNNAINNTNFFYIFFCFSSLFYYFQSKKIRYLYISGFIAVLSFFTKLDVGIPLILSVTGVIPLMFLIEKHKNILYYSIYIIVLIIGFCLLFNVELFNYLYGSLFMISGYNKTMYKVLETEHLYGIFLYLTFSGILFSAIIIDLTKEKDTKNRIIKLYQFALIAGIAFVLFKKGITRISVGSLYIGLHGIPIIFVLYFLFFHNAKNIKKVLVFLLALLVFIKPELNGAKSFMIEPNEAYKDFKNISGKFTYNSKYVEGLRLLRLFDRAEIKNDLSASKKLSEIRQRFLKKQPRGIRNRLKRKLSTYKDFKENFYLPKPLRTKIGKASVDIYHQNTSLFYYNNLNYKPRPVFQCLGAYTKYLDDLNAESITNDSKAPEYILWLDDTAINNRNALWQCPNTYKQILNNYVLDEVVYPTSDFWKIVLKRESQPIETAPLNNTISFNLNEKQAIPVSPDRLMFANLKVEETLKSKIISILFKNKPLTIEIELENGQIRTHQIEPQIVKNGIIINKYIRRKKVDDNRNLFKHNFSELIDVQSIKVIGDAGYYKKVIQLEL